MPTPYVGEIRMFAGNFAPQDWLLCAGQLVAISQYDVLFTLLGTTYGGDGQVTFGLPDLRGRVPVHPGTSSVVLGQSGGAENVTLVPGQLPSHTHTFMAVTDTGTAASPESGLPAASYSVTPYLNDPATGGMAPGAVAPFGGSQPHPNMQPYLCINFIISPYGIFPSQG